ncbi:MAG: tyrosine-type recombinase/integrase [Eubacterium sp.]|nr:tyrosine-type recombinase/integrase [Eubacterium sp.]
MEIIIKENYLSDFKAQLRSEEKSAHTIQKYIRDTKAFAAYIGENPVTKERVMEYKEHLISQGYAVGSINSMLASLNSFLRFMGCDHCRVRHLRVQKSIYCPEEKELTRNEYFRLLKAAGKQPRLKMILETICGTGIRVSELQYFTLENVRRGEVTVSCKNKTRTILLPRKLRLKLLDYSRRQGIKEGHIFRTRTGAPVNRTNIWASMKKLCREARVCPGKVFPHNLRKLFARTFYSMQKDIAGLADVLGHSNINTTRIYIMTTIREHQKKIDSMGLVV